MVAKVAVTIGWRVLWFVAAVAIPKRLGDGGDRAAERRRVLEVEALRHERSTEPERLAFARLVEQIAGRVRVPRKRVETQLVQSLHRSTRSSVSRALAGDTRLQQLGAFETELVQDRPRVVAG